MIVMIDELDIPNTELWKYVDDTTTSETVGTNQNSNIQTALDIVIYTFYLPRLASRSKIELRNPPEDIRTDKIVIILEDRLYGKVFVELAWTAEDCPYYSRWVSRQN